MTIAPEAPTLPHVDEEVESIDLTEFEQETHGHLYSVRQGEVLILARQWGNIEHGINFRIQRSGRAEFIVREDDKHAWHVCGVAWVARGDELTVSINGGCQCGGRYT